MTTDAATAVAHHLINNGIVEQSGIRVSKMPDAPDQMVTLSEYSAEGGVGMQMGASTTYIIPPRLQLLVRGSQPPNDDYSAIYNRSHTIWRAITDLVDVELDGERYLAFVPHGIPELMRRDEKERIVFVSNFTVTKESSPP